MGNGQYVHDITDLSGPAGGSFSGTRHWFDVFLDVDKRHIYSEKRGYRNNFAALRPWRFACPNLARLSP